MEGIEKLFPLLESPKKIIITMHQKPDADAMGSSLGLYHYFCNMGHTVQVISPTNWANFLNWMPGLTEVMDYERVTAEADKAIDESDLLFCLDFNTLSRTKRMEPKLMSYKGTRILIDHHQQPQLEVFQYGISDTSKSSTSEMVYDFMMDAGHEDKINLQAAECIYAGVMTDTGSFRFPSTSANVHRLIAHLMDKGLSHSQVHESLFDNFSENRFRFLGNVLLHRMEVMYEFNAAIIAIPQSDLVKYDIKTGDTEGLVNFPLSIEGIKLACIIIDRGEERKCSFRSKGSFDVNVFARKYFDGGGHMNAAGGQSKEPLEEVVNKFKRALKENRELLTSYNF
jgi:phosphoesterase RecJ-like protein